MDIPFGAWLLEPDTEDSQDFMYHLQQTPPYTELTDSFSSSYFKDDHNVATRDHSISGVLDNQECHTTNATSSLFAPIVGSSTNSFTISFGDFTSPKSVNLNQLYGGSKLECHDGIKCKREKNLNEAVFRSIELPKKVSSKRRNRSQAQEHLLAERKRRDKLTQRFMFLHNLLPEIKKMDKATVLDDACKHIEHLRNRVKQLEAETSIRKKNVISQETTTATATASIIKKSKFHREYASSSSNSTHFNPEIKVRILGYKVLVRIYSYQKNSLLTMKALSEMERLHFTITCSSVLPISTNTALITIIAQMSEEFAMTAKDIVKSLQISFLKV